jgi:hypothetical protein
MPLVGTRGSRIAAIRFGLAGLLAAVIFSGCSTSAATIPAATATPAPTTNQLQPPAAPTSLSEWADFSDPLVPAYFKWTAPAGPIDGYYLWVVGGAYVDASGNAVAPPAAICGPNPGWETLPASATTYEIPGIEADPPVTYICAFNEAGTSPTVKFPITGGPATE